MSTPPLDLAPLFDFLKDLQTADAESAEPSPEDNPELEGARKELRRALGGDWKTKMLLGLVAELLKMALEKDEDHESFDGGSEDELEALIGRIEETRWSPPEAPGDDSFQYYKVRATHHRCRDVNRNDFHAKFGNAIAAVRVTLPSTASEAAPIQTAIGEVRPGDHCAFSVEEISKGYRATFTQHDEELDKPPVDADEVARVDLITGGRQGAHRFCPVSIYLAYDADDRALFYAVQSSNFFGQEARLYFGRSMSAAPIIARSGFEPTPFSSPNHCYRFWMATNPWPAQAPEEFMFRGQIYFGQDRHDLSAGDLVKYMDMDMFYEKDSPMRKRPVRAQAQAYARVCKLEEWQAEEHDDEGAIAALIHRLAVHVGGKLEWEPGTSQ